MPPMERRLHLEAVLMLVAPFAIVQIGVPIRAFRQSITGCRVTPGLRKLRAVRSEVLADQIRARAEARTGKTLAAVSRPGDSTSAKWSTAAGLPGPPDKFQRP